MLGGGKWGGTGKPERQIWIKGAMECSGGRRNMTEDVAIRGD